MKELVSEKNELFGKLERLEVSSIFFLN